MRFGTNAIVTATLLAAVQTTASVISRSKSTDACGQIYQRVHNARNGNSTVIIPGELGLQCLQAMPFESSRAVLWVKEFRKWLLFQSDLEILKDPPPGYQMPATDLIGTLDQIEKRAAGESYKNHWEFDTDVKNMIGSAYDGHLDVSTCPSSLMTYTNDVPLVSVSSNGMAIPKVYTFADARLLKSHQARVSPIVSINGVDAASYLEEISLTSKSQDRDALYNEVFLSNPIAAKGESWALNGLFSQTTVWPGANHTLRYANGTSQVVKTVVELESWNWKSGKARYNALCLPSSTSSTSSKRSLSPSSQVSKRSSRSKSPSGYLIPYSNTTEYSLLSFFPKSSNLNETAVLALPSFKPEDLAQFNNLARNFIKKAAKEGKKKMIIDLQGNGGGTISAGWNLFRLFFPDQEVYSATRFRAHEGINFIGEAFARLPLNNPDTYGNMLDWKENVTPDQEAAFSSWADLYGPYELLGVNSSSLFANNLTAISYPGAEPVSGYGAIPLDPKTQTFAAEDIILITDGYCASTCTLFTELMKAQGVRSIAFGGRPLAAPMQAMGGIKGAQVENLADMANLLAVAKELAKSSSLLSDEDLENWDKYVPSPLSEFPYQTSNATVNLLNAFGPTNDIVPRQFIYEAAECRRFFTFENIVDQETTWASAADAMFYGGGCVEGSMNGPGSLIPASA
ncbi:uncharacterized protein N7484_005809 [Penicillium longicatenatum]|uniref:uncharacterized protein n=1 Tax=Penicillium longicatenatum TaxID=1561947 RepID=UPI0025485CF4|nr:uncharacterized protein N7484_005809 [Penicillium longicatenatum]KAJ5643302.1 hypothetical protein N7484_005809 [Penicillium longicatenatum]